MPRPSDRTAITNRRARYDFEILETFECGIALVGAEVKSLRAGRANFQDAYARIEDGQVWLHGMHISPYGFATKEPPDPNRKRKLLLHRKEIDRLAGTTAQQGLTLVPLRVHFEHGLAKVDLGLARGKRRYDKRQALAERDAHREAERALKARR